MDAFERFVTVYPADDGQRGFAEWTDTATMALLGRDVPDYTRFQRTCARPSHGEGLIRFVGDRKVGAAGLSAVEWNGPNGWRTSWPAQTTLYVFAYDWLARQYALDRARTAGAEPLVSLLDPADGSVMESDMTFAAFIELLVGEDGSGILGKALHAAWRDAGGASPAPRQCVSFKQPLMLGGKQEVSNLELGDMDVSLTILAQLRARVRDARSKR